MFPTKTLLFHKNLAIPTLFLKVTVTNESDLSLYGILNGSYPIHFKSKEHHGALLCCTSGSELRRWALSQQKSNPTNEKPGCPMWQLPQALLVSYVTQSHVHLNSLHNQKLSKFLIFHSHESQPLKGNVTSSSAMEDDLNHRNSTSFQSFLRVSQHLPLVEDVESLSPTSMRACFVTSGQKHECCYVVRTAQRTSMYHIIMCIYIYDYI